MRSEPPQTGAAYVSRLGKMIKADAASYAWTSRSVERMVLALGVPTNPIDRHFLLQTLVAETYRRRKDPEMRKTCREVAATHLRELPAIIPALLQEIRVLPHVTTFPHLATVLTEDAEYDRAIETCKIAQELGFDDGTKGGFNARIARIEKKRRVSATERLKLQR